MSKFKVGDVIIYSGWHAQYSSKYTIVEVKTNIYNVKDRYGLTYNISKVLLENNYKLISKRAAHPLTNIFN